MGPKRAIIGLCLGLAVTIVGCDAEGEEGAAAEAAPVSARKEGVAASYADLARAEDPTQRDAWVLQPKMTVGEIVDDRYGSRHYSRAVLLHNDIKDASRLPVGKRIATPALSTMLLEEPGLRRRAGAEMSALAELRRVFMGVEAELAQVIEAASDPMQVTAPEPLATKLRLIAAEFERLGEAMAAERPEVKSPPTKLVGSLLEAAAILERAAGGEVQDEKLDVEAIHQCLGNAMADALIWARVERR